MGNNGMMRAVTNRAVSRRGFLLALAAAVCALVSSGTTAAEPLRIVAFGDSLMAGYGLAQSEGFPAKLQTALRAKGHDVEVIDAGVSGDTAAGGLARLDWSVPKNADAVILELGANDALRAVNPAETRKSLDEALRRLKGRKVEVLLAGMMAPPNMGGDYSSTFNRIFPELAQKHGVLLYPFFLDGVAAIEKLNQRDGIHPTAAGIDIIVERILPSVEKLIAQTRANRKD